MEKSTLIYQATPLQFHTRQTQLQTFAAPLYVLFYAHLKQKKVFKQKKKKNSHAEAELQFKGRNCKREIRGGEHNWNWSSVSSVTDNFEAYKNRAWVVRARSEEGGQLLMPNFRCGRNGVVNSLFRCVRTASNLWAVVPYTSESRRFIDFLTTLSS